MEEEGKRPQFLLGHLGQTEEEAASAGVQGRAGSQPRHGPTGDVLPLQGQGQEDRLRLRPDHYGLSTACLRPHGVFLRGGPDPGRVLLGS